MREPFFAMRNIHGTDAGEPPICSNDAAGNYHGYFENGFGEHRVFVYNSEIKTGELCRGDAGWRNKFSVTNGRMQGLRLGGEKLQWLQACWVATTGMR
jgi:hypothetical protein